LGPKCEGRRLNLGLGGLAWAVTNGALYVPVWGGYMQAYNGAPLGQISAPLVPEGLYGSPKEGGELIAQACYNDSPTSGLASPSPPWAVGRRPNL